jgi:hypothetical protein
MTKRIIWHCIFPLLIGFSVYLFFHQPNLKLHQWLADSYSFPNFYGYIKNNPIAIFFLHHFPDALWNYSLTCFLMLFFSNTIKINIRAAIIVSLVSLTEIIQVFFSQQLTFDWIDLLLALVISLLTLNYFTYEKKNII